MRQEEERESVNDIEENDLPDWVKNIDHTTSEWPDDFDIDDLLPKKEEIKAFIKQQKESEGIDLEDKPYSFVYVKDEQRFKMLDKQSNEIKPNDVPVSVSVQYPENIRSKNSTRIFYASKTDTNRRLPVPSGVLCLRK